MSIIHAGLRNWKTTVMGISAAIETLAAGSHTMVTGTPSDKMHLIGAALFTFLLGFYSKDGNKTGV